MKSIITLLTLLTTLLVSLPAYSQNRVDINDLKSDYVLKENRDNFKKELIQSAKNVFNSTPEDGTEKQWISTWRELELVLYKSDFVLDGLGKAAKYLPESSRKFQRAFIEAVITFYPDKFYKEIMDLYQSTKSTSVFSIAAYYLAKHPTLPLQNETIVHEIETRFPNYENITELRYLAFDLSNDPDSLVKPPLEDLLGNKFQEGKTIIYSIHRKDRRYHGITIIKGPDGKFVRDDSGKIAAIPQLAISTSGIPGYLSQGNTPQGVFSVVGFYVSPTASIGPSPCVLTRIAHEVSTKVFYHGKASSKKWILKDYKDLLPDSWKNYLPIYESFYAGKAGRKLMVMHGSTDDLSFYKDQLFYPITPSKGCLTTKEIWDENNGKLNESDQVKLMNTFFSTKQLYGFLVVVELDNKKEPVTLEEVLPVIKSVEK